MIFLDKRKSILNISVSVAFRLATVIMSILVRRLLIFHCGNEVNGLNSLYLSIIGMLGVTELGVGMAITFCMYRPIVEGNNSQVSALYYLFQKLYVIIGMVVLIGGLALTPFLSYFAKDYAHINVDLYSTFLLMLVSTFVTYMFGAKTALINAYKNNYITTAISSGGILFQYVLQIVVLLSGGSFQAYLACRIFAAGAQWSVSDAIVRRKHGVILQAKKEKLDEENKKEVVSKIKAMFMHKIGSLLVNTVDSVVISAFVGVIALGEYTNYTTILTSVVSLLSLVFTSLTSIFGHMYVSASKKTVLEYSVLFHYLNFIIGTVFFLGYYAIVDALIAILFSSELIVAKSISQVITLNGFVQFMRQSTMVFRDATGTFYHDRWKPLVEGLLNIILSVLLVRIIGVTGVIAATIVTNLLICHVVEPYVLYKNALEANPVQYYLRNYSMILLFFGAMMLLDSKMISAAPWRELMVNGTLSVAISLVLCSAVVMPKIRRWKKLLLQKEE